MRRLLTGYAGSFNRRHRRYGHLFQNRYKSLLCQEDTYFLELVRYLHLNPLQADLVEDLKQLDTSPYAGHSVLMGKRKNFWQDTGYVLQWFNKRRTLARRLKISPAAVSKSVLRGERIIEQHHYSLLRE